MGKFIDLDETMKNLAKANMSRTGNEFERFLLSQSTVEAIPKDQYEARLKADLKAILVELQLEIGEKHREEEFMNDWNNGYNSCLVDGYNFIQQKINALKGAKNE